jgi:hypothetical protein
MDVVAYYWLVKIKRVMDMSQWSSDIALNILQLIKRQSEAR